jgi:hypothetical protein
MRNFGRGDRSDHVGHVLAQLERKRIGRLLAGPKDDEREDRLAADRVVLADDRRLGDGWWSTSADSTSIVLSRWPATFMTSSTRPRSQR